MNFNETEFEIHDALSTVRVTLPVSGEHTIYNIVASVVAALSCGLSFAQSFAALKSFAGVPGRLQKVEGHSAKTVFVDYAHTPNALENVLHSLCKVRRSSGAESKIITVFGCGGDRDRSKRPLMAGIAARLSDFVLVTSDNPRTEDPQAIVNEVAQGLPANYQNVRLQVDREMAIKEAIALADEGDVVLIAGKGHEDYQIIGTEKKYFSDVEMSKKYLNKAEK